MFAYCNNNPVSRVDASGEMFFTAIGALSGFLGSTVVSLMTGTDMATAINNGIAGAAGGAIAGAGVDAALLLIGSFGTAAPILIGACTIAYATGGVGNIITASLSSEEPIDPTVQIYNFAIGGMFNLFSFLSGIGCAAKALKTIDYLAQTSFDENLLSAVSTALATSIATEIAMTNNSKNWKSNHTNRELLV